MSKKIIIFVKSVDGGTGTFLLQIQKLESILNVRIDNLILEKPTFRSENLFFNSEFFNKNFPEKYTVSISLFILLVKELFWIRKNILNKNPKIVITIDTHCSILILIYKLLFNRKLKVITTIHNNVEKTAFVKLSYLLTFILKTIIKLLYPLSNLIITVSNGVAFNLKNHFGVNKRILTIYNGIPVKSNLRFKPKKKNVILFIGRLVEQKDPITLINAFYLLQKDIPSSKLVIVGDGPLKKTLKNLVFDLGISKKVNFIGWVEKIDQYTKTANIFVLTSKREGFGYALIEAMSYGLPIVSTNAPYGPSEILDNGRYGVLVNVNSSQEIKDSLIKLLKNKETYNYFSKQSFNRSHYFSEELMFKKYAEILKPLL